MTRKRLLSAGTWLGAATLVVLAARSLAYRLAEPTSLRAGLQHTAGGPRLVVVALVALGLTVGLAAAVVWLATLGVRERAVLAEGRPEVPRLRLPRVATHALVLTLATCGAFAVLESYLHLRAGLQWHGFGCLTGPVHVGAMPILAGLSVLSAAVIDAVGHVLQWMRRTIRLLLERPPRLAAPAQLLSPIVDFITPPEVRLLAARPRPPPLLVG